MAISNVTSLPLGISVQSRQQSASPGEAVSLLASGVGGGTFGYRWFLDGVLVSGAQGEGLVITNASALSAGRYTVVVSNATGSVTSAPINLAVSPTTQDIRAAAFGPSGFVAVSSGSETLWSSNGLRWSASSALAGWDLLDVAYGNGLYAVLARNPANNASGWFTSSDGRQWVQSANATSPYDAVAFGNGVFATVSSGGYNRNLAWSYNMLDWSSAYPPSGYAYAYGQLSFAGDRFFMPTTDGAYYVLNNFTSGRNFSYADTHQSFAWFRKSTFAYGNGRYVVLDDKGWAMSSTNGLEWRTSGIEVPFANPSDPTVRAVQSLIWLNGAFVAAGPSGRMFVSQDGLSWASSSSGCRHPLSRLVYGNGLLLGFGIQGTIAPLPVPPTVQITYPTEVTPLTNGVPLTLSAVGGSAFSTVTNVVFFVDDFPVGSASAAPFQVQWIPTQNRGYRVHATAKDRDGNISESSRVAVNTRVPPYFVQQPSDQTAILVESVTFSATALGNSPLRYNWFYSYTTNGYLYGLANGTEPTFSIDSVGLGDARYYTVIVTNAFGSVQSRPALLSVISAPVLLQQPQNATNQVGDTVVLRAEAIGVAPLVYQWLKNGRPVIGQTNKSFTLRNAQYSDWGTYSMTVTNAYGAATSSNALLVIGTMPTLAQAIGGSPLVWTSFGDAPWFAQPEVTHDGADAAQSGRIGDNQQSILQASVTGPGAVVFWWKVSSELDYDKLKFFTNGVEAASISGDVDWELTAYEVGSGSQTFRWGYLKDGSASKGWDAGWVDSIYFLQPTSPPVIMRHPADATVVIGGNVVFDVIRASMSPQVSCQWQFSGANLVGATNDSLLLTNVQPNRLGNYRVVVSNPFGSAVSSNAALTVVSPSPFVYDFAEGNAGNWDGAAVDGQPVVVSDAAAFVRVGSRSIRLDTTSSDATGVGYPRLGDAHWKLTETDSFAFWLYPLTTSPYGFSDNQPFVYLQTPTGGFFFQPRMPLTTNGLWTYYVVPLAGNAIWERKETGTPSLADVNSFLIGHWSGGAGFTAYYDGVRFITQTPIFTGVRVLPNRNSQVSFYSPTNRMVYLQASTNLTQWTSILTNQTGGDPLVLTDTNAYRFKQRFYRAVVP